MSTTMVQCLSRATTATFEELALLFPEIELSTEQAAAPLDTAASVDFRGPMAGRLVLRASRNVMPLIAANMMGADQSRFQPLQNDALGEIANVICGHVLPMIAGADAIFNLAAPIVHAGESMPLRRDDDPVAHVAVGVEDGRAEALLFVFDTGTATRARPGPSSTTIS